MSGCSQTHPLMLHTMAKRGVLSGLRVLEANDAWAPPPARCEHAAYVATCSRALTRMILSASYSLVALHLNGGSLPDDVLDVLGAAAPNLRSLAMVGNGQLTDQGLRSLAQGCSHLASLEVAHGARPPAWRMSQACSTSPSHAAAAPARTSAWRRSAHLLLQGIMPCRG